MDDEIQKEADRLMDIINEIAYDKSVPSLMVDCEVANILTENERRLKHQIEMLEGANDAWQKRSAELARLKPDWDDIPADCIAIQISEYGQWEYMRPVSNGLHEIYRFDIAEFPRWRETLERRPESE